MKFEFFHFTDTYFFTYLTSTIPDAYMDDTVEVSTMDQRPEISAFAWCSDESSNRCIFWKDKTHKNIEATKVLLPQ